ncbi:nicotinate (nicotinamide) nucleotide adenylyltransferase [Ruminococcus sp.]|uniref:nicotinate (nicotinamide) nucleotide adenylyltransferase n=1 Tax=Ruminococcus sp. TaxID=41978 RepID=UPI003993AF98
MERIGLFGGSFNPIHNGHLHLVQVAKDRLHLDRVILIPARVSPFKQQHPDMASPEDRLEMCRLAAETLPFCQVDSYELEQKAVSYSIYTVAHFRRKFPDAALVLLVGSDMFLSFCSWYRWQDILRNVALGVVSREADDQAALRRQQAFFNAIWQNFFYASLRFTRYLLQKFGRTAKML